MIDLGETGGGEGEVDNEGVELWGHESNEVISFMLYIPPPRARVWRRIKMAGFAVCIHGILQMFISLGYSIGFGVAFGKECPCTCKVVVSCQLYCIIKPLLGVLSFSPDCDSDILQNTLGLVVCLKEM
ncbi:hypothetical protein EYC84_004415 [Monilinia fructicola]|uniref:Uncharacterized protein n=1 Tax=Monilinia fructicola TaxID=38448 RepID=A0A5M9K5B8_MONFR|nr:hypothetical protein EYC84_004415 [Monilinia fructicola]